MRALIPLIALALWPLLSSSQAKEAYRLFDRQGQVVHFEQVFEQAARPGLVLFGELHNNPIAHWLQFELLKDLHERSGLPVRLGAEMFEAHDQLLLDEYLGGLIAERNFRSEARLWRNYETDIRPLVEYAREHGIPFTATNIPRRYAAMVHRGGFEALEALGEQALAYLPPLPIPYDAYLPAYQAMLQMEGLPAHTGENFPKAQAVKDATMAWHLLRTHVPGHVSLHVHGAYHSNHDEGMVWYLRQYDSEDHRILTISTVEQESLAALEERHLGLADFIIVVPASMTKTH